MSEAAKTPVHAFVSSRLDYGNCLLYGVSDGLLKKLQAVQNSAAPNRQDRYQEVRQDNSGIARPSLASYPAADTVQTCHDRL